MLFDLDGVLVDSTAAVREVWRAFAVRHGMDEAFLDELHGRRMVDLITDLLPTATPATIAAECDWLERLEVSSARATRAIAGASALTASLPEHRWAIATSGTSAVARARLAAGGIRLPTVLVTAEQVTTGKPSPEPYLEAAARLGVPPARCVVIEDAPAGILAARAAGAQVVAVATSHAPEQLRQADWLVGSVASIVRATREHGHALGAPGLCLGLHDAVQPPPTAA